MKTITFYSYKGGVGRSLALCNIAERLAFFGKKVCLLDFDLEAPGLHHKFGNYIKQPISSGLVDYIYSYAHNGLLPATIANHSIPIELYKNTTLHLIPAGNTEQRAYWQQLSAIDWYSLLYENPDSVSFFLDLKQKIKEELKPDFLLIDSRTGISEMSGVTLSLFADEVVVVSVNNKENLMGSKRIIDYLLDEKKAIFGKAPRVSFVLSRIPYPETPAERGKEQQILAKIQSELSNINLDSFFILHSDRKLELDEETRIGRLVNPDSPVSPEPLRLTNDYLKVFKHLTEGQFTQEDKTLFDNIKESEQLYQVAVSTSDVKERIKLLESVLSLNPSNLNAHLYLAASFLVAGEINKGEKYFDFLLDNFPNLQSEAYNYIADRFIEFVSPDRGGELFKRMLTQFPHQKWLAYNGLGYVMHEKKQYADAVAYYTQALSEADCNEALIYNNRATAHIYLKNYAAALEDVFAAISIDPDNAAYHLTLAEIRLMEGRMNEFYLSLENALGKDSKKVFEILSRDPIYTRVLEDTRFINMLAKYDVPLPTYPNILAASAAK